jgi:hypothetical protein
MKDFWQKWFSSQILCFKGIYCPENPFYAGRITAKFGEMCDLPIRLSQKSPKK